MTKVTRYQIQSESEEDDFLKGLLEEPKYRSMDEIEMRAQDLIGDARLKNYFISRAREMLKIYDRETKGL